MSSTPANALPLVMALFLVAACESPAEQPGPSAMTPVTGKTANGRHPSPEGAAVRFTAPENGSVVSSPVTLEFEVSGMKVRPAGTAEEHSGHHHVLVNTGLPDFSLPVPMDANHLHFGDGRSSTKLELPPGKHTLQLLFADYLHIPHDTAVYSEPITIEVK